jgi:hypothetical protein
MARQAPGDGGECDTMLRGAGYMRAPRVGGSGWSGEMVLGYRIAEGSWPMCAPNCRNGRNALRWNLREATATRPLVEARDANTTLPWRPYA